jgi:HlyD family secretion protein
MKKRILILVISTAAALFGCSRDANKFDASGTFEANEVIVSAEIPGKLLSFNVEEGSQLAGDSVVGIIDSVPLVLQKSQVEASMQALHERTADVSPQVKLLQDQVAVQQVQLDYLQKEKARTERLVKADAATTRQLDEITNQIDVLTKQIDVNSQQIKVQQNMVGTQNRGILSETRPLKQSIAQLQDQVRRSMITNPVGGTVLTRYAMAGEVVTAGKALYKIADLSQILLRAYISGPQLSQVKLNQQVLVLVDSGANAYRKYTGTITWISDKAEFTPKTIQTKDERANLVYAIKIRIKNDGLIKIGMYGEVNFNLNAKKD